MVREVPGRDKPAAVAADARDDEYGGGVKPSLCKIGKTATGVLHHLHELDVEILDHDAVDLAHLIRRNSGHVRHRR